jgi:hypothetical protein
MLGGFESSDNLCSCWITTWPRDQPADGVFVLVLVQPSKPSISTSLVDDWGGLDAKDDGLGFGSDPIAPQPQVRPGAALSLLDAVSHEIFSI